MFSPRSVGESFFSRQKSNCVSLNFCFLSQLGHSWLLCSLGARRCLYMGKISRRSTKQLPWIFTMLEQECFMLILKWLQRYLERFEARSTELYPLSEEGKRNRDVCCCQNLWGSNEFRIRQSEAVRSNITVLWVAHLFTFHLNPSLMFCQLSLMGLNQWEHMWVQLVQTVKATVCAELWL